MKDLTTCIDFDPELDFKATPIWLLDEGHCTPPWTPLFAWYWGMFCYHGGAGAMEAVSLPFSRTTFFRLKNGGVYYGFSRVDDPEEAKEREKKFRSFIQPYLEDYDKNWKGMLVKELMPLYERLKQFDVDNASNMALWEHVEDCFSVTRKMWYFHVLGMYITWFPYVLLENVCKQLLQIDDTHPTFLKLITGFDNKIFQVDRRMWNLSKAAKEMGISEILTENSAKDIIPLLEENESGKLWLDQFYAFLQEDGWRSQRRAEMIDPSWIEEPFPPLGIIKMYMKRSSEFDLEKQRKKAIEEREAAEKEILAKIPAQQKDYFAKLLKVAQQAGSYGEEHSYYCEDYCFAITRRAFIAIGKRYVAAGAFDKKEDIFFLLPDEIHKIIYAPQHYDLRPIIEKRRADWGRWCEEGNPPFLLKEGVSHEEIGPHLASLADPIFFKALMGAMPEVDPELKADLYGVVGSTGICEGPARVILDEKDLRLVEEGDILVAVNTAPSWTPVFNLIKGAVIDRGGSLAHAAVVGREFGIPVVLNVFEGTKKIKTGQRIRVDANMGVVYFLDD